MPPLLVTEDFVKRQTAHRQKLLREALAAVKAKEQAEAAQAAGAGSSNDPVVKQEPASSPAAAAAAQPQAAGDKPPMPLTVLTPEQRQRNMEKAKEKREQHRRLLESEGRPPPETDLYDADKLPSFTEDEADAATTTGQPEQTEHETNAATSSIQPMRTPCVLTPGPRASPARQNSYPQFHKLANRAPKAKREERRAADDPLYSVSLGTESDEDSGRPDPTWWARSPRGQRKRERDPPALRSSTAVPARGRSPPPGMTWKDLKLPKGKPVHKKSRVSSAASRKQSADKRKHSVDKRDL